MARPPRPIAAGATYHITARGNNGEEIFCDDTDRYAYLALLQKVQRAMMVQLLAYALMTNHVHLVLRTPAPNISMTVHRLHGPYATYFNRRHGRTGHLFASRFSSRVVEDNVYLLELSRYVHLNPVRARLASRPEEYPWSSYGFYVTLTVAPSMVDVRPVLELIGLDISRSRIEYANFIHAGCGATTQAKESEVPAMARLRGKQGK